MGFFLNAYARTYQTILYVASAFLKFKEPEVISGENSLLKIPNLLKKLNKKSVLVVTDESIFALGLVNPLLTFFEKENFKYSIYHGVVANPTVDNVEEGLKIYLENKCDCLVAVGGGSSMDCAKVIAARSSNLNKSVNKMKGLLKVTHKLPALIAVPTTAGTGSETTVAAVIVDKKCGDKYAINDPKLIPPYAILDPTLLVGLPDKVTSTTGMDALTHAVEAFIGHENTKKTKKYALSAIKLIDENLVLSYQNPKNLTYRNNMQLASYQAGVAFTRAYVGTVHAIAHALGGKYNVPHGLANAIILPKVLKAFGDKAVRKLSLLADSINLGKGLSNKEKANLFIAHIEEMNKQMNITNTFGNLIKDEDIDFLVNHAYKEGVPLYPTPRILSRNELKQIYLELQKGE